MTPIEAFFLLTAVCTAYALAVIFDVLYQTWRNQRETELRLGIVKRQMQSIVELATELAKK